MALPATKPPLILVRNVFDATLQYPGATISASNELTGSEAWRVGNYRRDRDWWEAATDLGGAGFAAWVMSDLGAGALVAGDFAFIDRGHNLWGKTVSAFGSLDNVIFGRQIRVQGVVPANPGLGTGTGDPTTGWAVTEEGALYTLSDTPTATARYWRIQIEGVTGFKPRIPGIIMGLRHQLVNYSTTYDEDAGERTEDTTQSRYGTVADDRHVSWRKMQLTLSLIGRSEYDTSIRELRRLMFGRNVPAVVFKNYGISPYRGWMYRYAGKGWGMPVQTYYRSGQITLREHDHLVDAAS